LQYPEPEARNDLVQRSDIDGRYIVRNLVTEPVLAKDRPSISLYHLTKWWALMPARPLPPRFPAPRRFLWVPPPHVRDPRYFERLFVGILLHLIL